MHTVDSELTLQFTFNPDGSHLTIPPVDQPGTAHPTQTLRLPTEAFVRLVYGRLDTHHTPAIVEAAPGLLDTLRAALPGA